MNFLVPLLLCSSLAAADGLEAEPPEDRLAAATRALAKATTDQQRFYALNEAAKQNFVAGNTAQAKLYAYELLTLAPRFPKDWNYGNSIQDANVVLGRIAVLEGRFEDAKSYLIAAGRTPGSPQLNTFGPNVSLARDLLDHGDRDVVIQYLTLCRAFWKMHGGSLDTWTQEIKDGKIPDFGANLIF